VLPLAWATHLWILRRHDEDEAGLANRARHIAMALDPAAVGRHRSRQLAEQVWLPGQDLWSWLSWIAVWLLAGRTLHRALAEDPRWPWAMHRDGYVRWVLWPVCGLLLLTVTPLQTAHDGGSALRYLPLASALDLASIAALLWLAKRRLLPACR
jgi:hypothetical protein